MREQPLISFIIPAYNAVKKLERCVRSILSDNETRGIEVIIVENGSTDETLRMAFTLGQNFDVIKVLQSEKGVSRARNAGINAARGTWISFVDADDFLTERAVRSLRMDAERGDADLYFYSYEKGSQTVKIDDGNFKGRCGKIGLEACRAGMMKNPTRYMTVWAKLFRREILMRMNVRFNEKLNVAEDGDFVVNYSRYCNVVAFKNEVIYHYSIEGESTMRKYDVFRTEAYITALQETQKFIRNESECIRRAFMEYVLMHLNIIMVRNVFCEENPHSYLEKIKEMKMILMKDIFRNTVREFNVRECNSIRLLPILLLKGKMTLPAAWIYSIRVRQNRIRERCV